MKYKHHNLNSISKVLVIEIVVLGQAVIYSQIGSKAVKLDSTKFINGFKTLKQVV